MSTNNGRQYFDAPELVPPQSDSGLETVKPSGLEVNSHGTAEGWKRDVSVYSTLEGHPSDYTTLEPYGPGPQRLAEQTPAPPYRLEEVASPYKPNGAVAPKVRPRWRRKMYFIAILCALIFVLGAVLGGVLGTLGRRRRNKHSGSL